MIFLLRFIKFLVYSNCWIGIGAAAFTWQFYLIYKQPVNYPLIGFAFSATVVTYTFQRYVKIIHKSRAGGDRIEWMNRNPILVKGLMVLGSIGCIPALLNFGIQSYFTLFISGLLSLFYVIKIPGKWNRNLRDIPSLKIFLIGIVWAVTSTVLPYLSLNNDAIVFPWLLFLTNFVFIIAITIPFDIRDLILDEREKQTIPQLIGEKSAVQISLILLIINWCILNLITNYLLISTLIGTFISIAIIQACKSRKNDLYFSFLIDGLLIILPIFLFLDQTILKLLI